MEFFSDILLFIAYWYVQIVCMPFILLLMWLLDVLGIKGEPGSAFVVMVAGGTIGTFVFCFASYFAVKKIKERFYLKKALGMVYDAIEKNRMG